jgi:uncharacterized protein
MLALHKTTLELTTEDFLTLKGDCIVGINASSIPVAMRGDIEIILEVGEWHWSVRAIANPSFTSKKCMVIRRSTHLDERTYATNASAAAKDIPREMVELLKDPKARLEVRIHKV